MERICEEHKCTGCGACYNSCPKDAIKMAENKFGELRPVINKKACIDCAQCIRSCPVNGEIEKHSPQKAYAVWSKNEKDRRSSSSGGAASVFYQKIIQRKGIAVGTGFHEKLELYHECAKSRKEIRTFKGSKYVQSDTKNTFQQIKQYLNQGKEVLFVGTPCQVAGLRAYLKKEDEHLIAVDLICHGVPSQKILREHVKHVKKEADEVGFRGDQGYQFSLYQHNKLIYSAKGHWDAYLFGFLKGYLFRESCYQCEYAKQERCSDITIGDFWGLGNKVPFSHAKEQGVSVILVNTEKGNQFFDACKEELFWEERKVCEAIEGNAQLNHPCEKPERVDEFREKYAKVGFEKAARQVYGKELYQVRCRILAGRGKRMIKKWLRMGRNRT